MHNKSAFTILVEEPDSGKRLDLFIASHISDCSRSAAAILIRNGKIIVRGAEKKPGYRIRKGDEIRGLISPPEPVLIKPEPIEINILYDDDHLIVVNKQPGLVVHPAPGHYTSTLVNGLLYHFPELEGIGDELRSGIVHRLDKDTSGVLVVAKNAAVHHNLTRQFKSRKINKRYLALVHGEMKSDSGLVSLPIGRHPVERKKMSTRSRKSRSAETLWRARERFGGITLVELDLKTGRTHQIRIHFAAVNHPIIGDSVYGRGKVGKKVLFGKNLSIAIPRHMLHAWHLGFTHPNTETAVSFEAPMPHDMEELIKALRHAEHSSA
ncbi:MAG: RluA family pseudouridine synthase [Desulfobacterales bacterium]